MTTRTWKTKTWGCASGGRDRDRCGADAAALNRGAPAAGGDGAAPARRIFCAGEPPGVAKPGAWPREKGFRSPQRFAPEALQDGCAASGARVGGARCVRGLDRSVPGGGQEDLISPQGREVLAKGRVEMMGFSLTTPRPARDRGPVRRVGTSLGRPPGPGRCGKRSAGRCGSWSGSSAPTGRRQANGFLPAWRNPRIARPHFWGSLCG